jgi:hypothetical protein
VRSQAFAVHFAPSLALRVNRSPSGREPLARRPGNRSRYGREPRAPCQSFALRRRNPRHPGSMGQFAVLTARLPRVEVSLMSWAYA